MVYELPPWLVERLALASPAVDGSFELSAEGSDVWPVHVGEFPIWPENQRAFDVFKACYSQWHHAGSDGVKTGLNYAGVAVVANAFQWPLNAAHLAQLQACESGALGAWADQRAHDAELRK